MQINWTHSAQCIGVHWGTYEPHETFFESLRQISTSAKERYIKDGPTDQQISPVTAHTAWGSWLSGPGVTWRGLVGGLKWEFSNHPPSYFWFSIGQISTRISLLLKGWLTFVGLFIGWPVTLQTPCWCLKLLTLLFKDESQQRAVSRWMSPSLALAKPSPARPKATKRPSPAPSHRERPPSWVLTLILASHGNSPQ